MPLGSEPIIFDKQRKLFWRGKRGLVNKTFDDLSQLHVSLESIYALQLVSKHVGDYEYSRNYYELNLVLEDAQRLYVVAYTSTTQARNDAQFLSDFLGIEVWDNTNEE